MRNGFIYEWVNTTNGIKYVGRHEGFTDDGYIGSGPKFVQAYNSNPEHFVRTILWEGDITNSQELAEIEDSILGKIDPKHLYYGSDRKYYNQVNNSYGFTSEENPMKNTETVKQMVQTQKELGYLDPYSYSIAKYGIDGYSKLRSNISIGNKNGAGNRGTTKTDLHKKRIANAVKARHKIITNSGRKPKYSKEYLADLIDEFGYQGAADKLNLSYNALYHMYRRKIKCI